MVNVLVTISEQHNRVLNMVKAKYDLRTKSEALDKVIEDYVRKYPEFSPENPENSKYLKKQKR